MVALRGPQTWQLGDSRTEWSFSSLAGRVKTFLYPLVIQHGNGKSPSRMEVLLGKSPFQWSIFQHAMFDYRSVSPNYGILSTPRSMGSNMVEANVTGRVPGQRCAALYSISVGCLVVSLEAGALVWNHIAIRGLTAWAGYRVAGGFHWCGEPPGWCMKHGKSHNFNVDDLRGYFRKPPDVQIQWIFWVNVTCKKTLQLSALHGDGSTLIHSNFWGQRRFAN